MFEQYLLRKRGLYYRPSSQGYTLHIREAGLYSEEEATDICQNGAVEPLPVSVMHDLFVSEITQLEKSTAEMKSRLVDLVNLKDANKRPKGSDND